MAPPLRPPGLQARPFLGPAPVGLRTPQERLAALAGGAPQASKEAAQKATVARVAELEARIEADAFDVAAWDGRLREAVQEGKAAPVFERAVSQFPTAARIWTAYAEWSEGDAGPKQALQVYQRCIQQVPSLDLWTSYLTFCKRHHSLEDIFLAYQRTVDMLGTDWRAGLLWAEYLGLLKHAFNVVTKKDNPDAEVSGRLLAEDASPIEAARRAMKPALRKKMEDEGKMTDISDEEFLRVTEALSVNQNMLRLAFQRACATAHSVLDKLWIGYEQFEKSLGNPQLAQKLLAEHMGTYVRGKSTFKELQTLCTGIDHFASATPLRQKTTATQTKQLEKWQGVLRYEQTNPLRLPRKQVQARVALVYQQASLSCAFFAEIWHDFSAWMDLGDDRERATLVLRQAIERFLPQDLTLRLLLAHRLELAEVPPSAESLQAADEEYRRLLENMPAPCPLALINHLAYVRRHRGPRDFRETFLEVAGSSPHCTWEVYVFAALTEYHVFGSVEAASGVFRLGLERHGDREPSLLAAYVNFLVGANDLRSARAELSRGVLGRLQAGVRDQLSNRDNPLVRESLAFLWQKWARLERYFGDAGALRRAASFRDEEYRNMQRDQDVEEDSITEVPTALGLATTMTEVVEGFRFQHLVPQTARSSEAAAPPAAGAAGAAAAEAAAPPAEARKALAAGELVDQAVADASDARQGRPAAAPGAPAAAAGSVHIARPDVSKMLSFRPALDVVGLKRPAAGTVERLPGGMRGDMDDMQLPTMIPKCLQDLLAVLPSRPLKGAKPDVDYLLTVLQTVNIPPIPVKDLESFRYDSLRLLKDEGSLNRRMKDELDGDGGGFFSSRPTIYRERMQAKRRRLAEDKQVGAKPEPAF